MRAVLWLRHLVELHWGVWWVQCTLCKQYLHFSHWQFMVIVSRVLFWLDHLHFIACTISINLFILNLTQNYWGILFSWHGCNCYVIKCSLDEFGILNVVVTYREFGGVNSMEQYTMASLWHIWGLRYNCSILLEVYVRQINFCVTGQTFVNDMSGSTS